MEKKIIGKDLIKASIISMLYYGDRDTFRYDRKCNRDLKKHVDQLTDFADNWIKELERIKPIISKKHE